MVKRIEIPIDTTAWLDRAAEYDISGEELWKKSSRKHGMDCKKV